MPTVDDQPKIQDRMRQGKQRLDELLARRRGIAAFFLSEPRAGAPDNVHVIVNKSSSGYGWGLRTHRFINGKNVYQISLGSR